MTSVPPFSHSGLQALFAQLDVWGPTEPDAATAYWISAAAFGAGALCVMAAWFLRVLRDRASSRGLAASEKVASECIERLSDVVLVFRLSDERVVMANRAACDLYCTPPELIVQRTLSELERLLPMGKEQISRTIALGTSPTFVSKQVKPDGSLVCLEITATVVDCGGERCVLSVGRDVSQRDLAAERGRIDLNAYKELFDSEAVASIVVDPTSERVVAANESAMRIFDPVTRAIVGVPVSRLVPSDLPVSAPRRVIVGRSDGRASFAVRAERSDVMFRGVAAYRYEFRIIGTRLGMSPDAEPESNLPSLFDSVLEAMLIVDPNTRVIVKANAAARQMYGYEGEELVGLLTDRITTDPQGCREICGMVVRDGERPGELRYHRRKNGEMIAVEANFSAIECEGRTCVLCSMRQISAAAMRGRPIFTSMPAPEGEAHASHPVAIEAKPGRRGRHLLVVDDEPLVREVTRRMLESAGFRVSAAADGTLAIALVEADPTIEVVVLDVTMPGMLGPQVRARMLEARPGLRVVLCSGYSSETISLESGPVAVGVPSRGFVQKPFTLEVLLAAIDAEVADLRS